MKEFIFRARMTYTGISVTVKADSLEDARALAMRGGWNDEDSTCAGLADWSIDENSGEENK